MLIVKLFYYFQLKENIQQYFTRFVGEGKATLRLVEPPYDICLSKVCAGNVITFLNDALNSIIFL